MNSSSRFLVLTVAANYGIDVLKPFVRSYQRHLEAADLVVFGGNLDPATVDWLTCHGARVVAGDFNCFWGGAGVAAAVSHWGAAAAVRIAGGLIRYSSRGRADAGPRIREAVLHLSAQRYFLYRRHLEMLRPRYDCVLLVDCRDSVFQGSPFPVSGLHVFAENENIGQSHFGRRWYELSYGHKAWLKHKDRPFLCSGVTLGDTASIIRYLDLMCSQMLAVLPTNFGVDQVVHNQIVHENRAGGAVIHGFGEGCAINLGRNCLSPLALESGRMLNSSGQPFAIVHQYDRVPGLKLAELDSL